MHAIQFKYSVIALDIYAYILFIRLSFIDIMISLNVSVAVLAAVIPFTLLISCIAYNYHNVYRTYIALSIWEIMAFVMEW